VLQEAGVLSKKSVLNQNALRIYDVNYWIRIPLVACREDSNFIILVCPYKTFMCVGANEKSASVGFIIFGIF
jgi:hypothetical protein